MVRSYKPMLRLLVALLCLGCLLCWWRPGDAAAQTEERPQTFTTLVREAPRAKAAVIGQMEDGTEVTVLGQTGDYYKVDCYDMQGFIAKTQILRTEDGKCYVNCYEGHSDTRVFTNTEHADALVLRHDLLALAKKQLGTPYVYGGKRPGGFDCSGLMYYLYGYYGIRLHRTASAQMQDGIIVAREGLQVGDLIFFKETGETTLCSHVGIYAGNNQIIHAGSKGIEYANLDSSYYADYYFGARRIVNTDATTVDTPAAPIATPATIGRRGR